MYILKVIAAHFPVSCHKCSMLTLCTWNEQYLFSYVPLYLNDCNQTLYCQIDIVLSLNIKFNFLYSCILNELTDIYVLQASMSY